MFVTKCNHDAPHGEKCHVVLDEVGRDYHLSWCNTTFLCYAQNKLFTYYRKERTSSNLEVVKTVYEYGKIICDYAVLPDYDSILERYNYIQVAQAEIAMDM